MCDFAKIQSLDNILIKKANKLYKNIYVNVILVIINILSIKEITWKNNDHHPNPNTNIILELTLLSF